MQECRGDRGMPSAGSRTSYERVSVPLPNMEEELLRIKDPFLSLVEIVGDLVGSRTKGLLDFGVPV